jgi:DNA mismatch endonuclease (patch repair protein)
MNRPSSDLHTDKVRSDLMRRVRQRRTNAEEEVAIKLRSLGIHYRRNVQTLPGSPDFSNKSRKWAIFVNGCFWHRHEHCSRTTTPTRNRSFWLSKFAANVRRDRKNTKMLRAIGFRVVVIWECELRKDALLKQRLRALERLQ